MFYTCPNLQCWVNVYLPYKSEWPSGSVFVQPEAPPLVFCGSKKVCCIKFPQTVLVRKCPYFALIFESYVPQVLTDRVLGFFFFCLFKTVLHEDTILSKIAVFLKKSQTAFSLHVPEASGTLMFFFLIFFSLG